ncbi:uracil-DNA glycosylase [Sphingomonas koreensis]|uniref:uracil-DNA glycosylase n=1 Tax=Sphingomonas koreensis TaxID=93064 RepID=UPI000836E95D|nr:uracil-DNA glycosylase [Sphingomonas koreensis]PJI90861.1 DNA polymerase [Sphingomonas koreensis]RSU60169.1 uracil-DNA glycosylase [Sphingomonas koreensis]RSU68107.1 uracil-DNA glycosylase [Sphingomonas koreensis]
MGISGAFDWRAEAASALEWWRDAGVDVLVDDDPRDWTAREAAPAVASTTPQPVALAEPEPEVPLPATLEAFIDWRFGSGAPESGWVEPIVAPTGNPAAPLMVITDFPESDGETPSLLSGPAGRLFDRMLAAIGLDRDAIYFAPLCAARPITGSVPRDAEERLGELLRHHIALTAPKRLLLLGQTVSRAVIGSDGGLQRGRLQAVNQENGQSLMVATFHPRFLLTRPAAKADAWKDLQLLLEEQAE